MPLDQSGLDLKDLEKVWTLQKEAVKNTCPPLKSASVKVWESLDQLRQKVSGLCGKHTGKDRNNLRRLLRRIKEVQDRRPSDSDGPIKSDSAEELSGTMSQNFCSCEFIVVLEVAPQTI